MYPCFKLQTLLPRGERPNHIRDRNAQVNELLSKKLLSKPLTQLLNIDPGFVQPNGRLFNLLKSNKQRSN